LEERRDRRSGGEKKETSREQGKAGPTSTVARRNFMQ
jgi:hypothetical protein